MTGKGVKPNICFHLKRLENEWQIKAKGRIKNEHNSMK